MGKIESGQLVIVKEILNQTGGWNLRHTAILAIIVMGLTATACAGNTTVSSTSVTTNHSTQTNNESGRPDRPPSVNEGFRADPASVVAATGKPQLIEFFAFW